MPEALTKPDPLSEKTTDRTVTSWRKLSESVYIKTQVDRRCKSRGETSVRGLFSGLKALHLVSSFPWNILKEITQNALRIKLLFWLAMSARPHIQEYNGSRHVNPRAYKGEIDRQCVMGEVEEGQRTKRQNAIKFNHSYFHTTSFLKCPSNA